MYSILIIIILDEYILYVDFEYSDMVNYGYFWRNYYRLLK